MLEAGPAVAAEKPSTCPTAPPAPCAHGFAPLSRHRAVLRRQLELWSPESEGGEFAKIISIAKRNRKAVNYRGQDED